MSESDCDSPAKASEVDEFLSKMNKVGKSAAKGSTGNQSDSSSDFGSVDKLWKNEPLVRTILGALTEYNIFMLVFMAAAV